MAHLLSDLVKYFAFDEINIDNWMFKMYYKVSMIICMTGATVGIASQYFGDPIRLVVQLLVVRKKLYYRIFKRFMMTAM